MSTATTHEKRTDSTRIKTSMLVWFVIIATYGVFDVLSTYRKFIQDIGAGVSFVDHNTLVIAIIGQVAPLSGPAMGIFPGHSYVWIMLTFYKVSILVVCFGVYDYARSHNGRVAAVIPVSLLVLGLFVVVNNTLALVS